MASDASFPGAPFAGQFPGGATPAQVCKVSVLLSKLIFETWQI